MYTDASKLTFEFCVYTFHSVSVILAYILDILNFLGIFFFTKGIAFICIFESNISF